MRPTTDNLRLPWVSLALLVLLLVLAPHTMSLPAFDFNAPDPLSSQRTALVILGLSITVAAFAESIFLLIRYREAFTTATCAAASLACAIVGWRSYPYWANGVYQVRIGAHSFGLQDPKDLIPMDWIGELWRLPVLLLYLICYGAVPFLLGVGVIAVRRRRYVSGGIIILCMAIVLVFMVGFSPGYVEWIMD